MQGSVPTRKPCVDWLSVSRLTSSDAEIRELREAVAALVREVAGYGERAPLKSAGNFGEGERFTRFGAQMAWTTRTQAQINQWDDQGRCVGWINFIARGSTGIGRLRLDEAASLIVSLADLGFEVTRRVDCTVDVFDHPDLSIGLIKRQLESGQWRIPRRRIESLTYHGPLVAPDGKVLPASLYLGSPDSPTRVIVYDKGAQLGEERPWLRFECKCRHEGAEGAIRALLEACNNAFDSGDALHFLGGAVASVVRSGADIRDVTAFDSDKPLPKNWANSSNAPMPAVLAPVFAETAPMDFGVLRVQGPFASRLRHLQRSSGKAVWTLCILATLRGEDPGRIALVLGIEKATQLTLEDFEEISKISGFTPKEVEEAELATLNHALDVLGIDGHFIESDKTMRRAELARMIGGVQ